MPHSRPRTLDATPWAFAPCLVATFAVGALLEACAEAPPTHQVLLPAPMIPVPRNPTPSTPPTPPSGQALGPICGPLSSERASDFPAAAGARDATAAEREFRDANFRFERGEYAASLAGYRRAVSADPFHGLAHLGVAESHLFTDNDVEAMQSALGRALAILPENARAHLRYADLAAELGDRRRAEAHYRCAVELKPEYAEARRQLARQLLAERRHAEAEAELRRALELTPGDVETLLLLADVLEAESKPREAAAAVERAAQQAKTSAPLYRRAAALYEAGGDEPAAKRTRAAADLIDPPTKSRKLRPLPKARERR